MDQTSWTPVLALVALTMLGCAGGDAPTETLFRAPVPSNVVDGVEWRAGNWGPHLAAGEKGSSWGNHRAVVVVDAGEGDVAVVSIPWRRRDLDPASHALIVVDSATGQPVANVTARRITREAGEIAFSPNVGSSIYYVYYLPWESTGGFYPTVTYPSQLSTPAESWRLRATSSAGTGIRAGKTLRMESVNTFHSFFPMEVAATEAERAAFMSRVASDGWAVIPEHRDFPIRMRESIPKHWTDRDSAMVFRSQVLRGEAFTLQLGVVAGNDSLSDVSVTFDGFAAEWQATCFTCGGIDERGRIFVNQLVLAPHQVHALWIGVRVPAVARPGEVRVRAIVTTNRGQQIIPLQLDVRRGQAINHGFNEPELMTRLEWLNSTVGTDPDFLIQPFVPVAIEGKRLSILGRSIELGANGFPAQLTSAFSQELTHTTDTLSPILTRPLELVVLVGGQVEQFTDGTYDARHVARGRVEWSVSRESPRFVMRVNGALEYDGMLDYRITLSANVATEVDDITLPISLEPSAARYMLGLGRRGGLRPASVDWKWNIENHQEGMWLGGINKGLQYVLRDDGYVRPLNTNFYQNQPLRLPDAWVNGGRGGIRLRTTDGDVLVTNYSGSRTLVAGDSLQFNVRFLITPFKPISTKAHFATRFVHKYVPVDSVKAWGGTVVNIHHANEINPYINYPFFSLEKQTAYIQEAHARGVKVKLYNTIRELTYRAHELYALRSLGDEVLNGGEGGGHSWLQEHLGGDYHSAWHAYSVDDAAVLNKGTSRWTNYYIEGLAWLGANQQIDGLYLDDIAFSRETVKRMISVLHAERKEVVIDLHSANQFNPRDGFTNSALLYMEHFPFISRLWFGEYFEYARDQDYWMTEVSGLPFGLMGEMLQDGGHPYRGLLYGMTARLYGDVDPRPVWRMMNEFGIEESRMLGYWLDEPPVTTGNPRVLATAYERPDGLLIALASWSGRDETVSLTLSPALRSRWNGGLRFVAPAVQGLQPEGQVDPSRVRVPADQGLFLFVRR